MKRLACSAVLLLPFLGAACGDSQDTSTTAPSTTSPPTTDTFASILPVHGADSQLFTVSQAGTFRMTLVSVGPLPTATVGVGFGIPNASGFGCFLNASISTTAGSSAQLTAAVDPGTYCVSVYDDGSLTGSVSFSLTIDHPATSAPTLTSPTEFFTGTLAPQSDSSYSFTVNQAGTVSLTLASLTTGRPGPTSNAIVGFGVGTPADTGCNVETSVNTAAALTPQISNTLTSGVHCVDIYDLGTLTAPLNFGIRIVHP